ncbi:hypothetical protein [Vibrio aerogenes]|uniref:hypothetical protein n=1 Tax=Vibrio aerogenes TaxID=92172 RepID=UPI001587FC43|nr:hypothetical protein [Vibrio aerogenes]
MSYTFVALPFCNGKQIDLTGCVTANEEGIKPMMNIILQNMPLMATGNGVTHG